MEQRKTSESYFEYKRNLKRRKLRQRRARVFVLVLALTAALAIFAVAADKMAQSKEYGTIEAHEPHIELLYEVALESEVKVPAKKYYDVPLERELQDHIMKLCEIRSIDPAIVMAMIERESDYRADCIGDNGKSYGLMQIQKRHHEDRMDNLGCTDLLDVYENVAVGIDYLAELRDKYDGNIEMALVAYNMGPTGAYRNCFSKGIYSSAYSREVLENSKTLMEGMNEYVYG